MSLFSGVSSEEASAMPVLEFAVTIASSWRIFSAVAGNSIEVIELSLIRVSG